MTEPLAAVTGLDVARARTPGSDVDTTGQQLCVVCALEGLDPKTLMGQAWLRHNGRTIPDAWQYLAERGWTPSLLRRVLRWARATCEQRNGKWVGIHDTEPLDPDWAAFAVPAELVAMAKRLQHPNTLDDRVPGWPVTRSLPWLAVLAASPTPADYLALVTAIYYALHSDGLITGWSDLPASTGALAYAAGLSAAEALELHKAGALDVTALRALSAVRGYRFDADWVSRG